MSIMCTNMQGIIADEERVKALFVVAGIEPKNIWRLANQYWPRVPEYAELRDANPWWLVQTELGMIELGPRKRVYHLDWAHTPVRQSVIPESSDITHSDRYVHCYTDDKLIEALRTLGACLKEVKDNMTNMVVDGTNHDGVLSGDGKNAPFYIFHMRKQVNVAGPFNTRDYAEREMRKLISKTTVSTEGK